METLAAKAVSVEVVNLWSLVSRAICADAVLAGPAVPTNCSDLADHAAWALMRE